MLRHTYGTPDGIEVRIVGWLFMRIGNQWNLDIILDLGLILIRVGPRGAANVLFR
eukprot:SAG11_NODE_1944_length_4019_cov_2.495792_5_plen_55_part_00